MEKALHLVSDGACDCLTAIVNTAMANYVSPYLDNANLKQYCWPFIKTEQKLRSCCQQIIAKPGMVLYTLRDSNMIQKLKACCNGLNIRAISAIAPVIDGFDDYLQESYLHDNSLQDNYLQNNSLQNNCFNDKPSNYINALNFTLNHDDGNSIETIDRADIIIVAPLRCFKTPIAMYLSCQGYKIANIPFTLDVPLPGHLVGLQNKLVIGLIAAPERLLQLRYSRLSNIYGASNNGDFDINHVTQECIMAKRIFLERNWPIFDVTYKSIEEISAKILKTYYLFQTDLVNE